MLSDLVRDEANGTERIVPHIINLEDVVDAAVDSALPGQLFGAGTG